MKSRIFLTLAIVLSVSSVSFSQNGQIKETVSYKFPVYQDLPPWMKNKYTSGMYEQEFGEAAKTQLKKIKYTSDGLQVVGFIYQPATAAQKLPVVIYNRPGIGEAAKTGNENFRNIYEMFKCASSGFIVVASQYRGIDGGEGKDEVGGGDVQDVLNLLPIIKSMPNADLDNIFIWGSSRGGSMALQMLKSGFRPRAIALVGAVTDWEAQLKHSDRLGRDFWPEFEKRKEEHIRHRSAIQWVDQIPAIPILIMHGGSDSAVDPDQALRFAGKLQENGKFFELQVFAGDEHLLPQHSDIKIDAIIEWFKKPRLISIAKTFDWYNKKNGIPAAITAYHKIKKDEARYYDFSERELNRLGYNYLFGGAPNDAIAVFLLNTEIYDNSPSAWDSLAEAYALAGNKAEAIKCYTKVLALDPGNKPATEALKKLKA